VKKVDQVMKNGMCLILDYAQVTELCPILMDDDAPAALALLETHLKGNVHDLLEGG
jgi:hypothetical protein